MMGALLKDLGGLALYTAGPRRLQSWSRPRLRALADRIGDLVGSSQPLDGERMGQEIARTVDLARPREEVVRQAWRLRALAELEVLRYPSLRPDTIDDTVGVTGLSHLQDALSRGRGAIVMIGHFGANQLIMPALGWRGFPIHQLSASPLAWASIRQDGRVNPLWKAVQERRWALEQSLPCTHIDVFGFLRPAYRVLQRNEVLGLAFDGGGGTRWMEVPLGKRRAWISTQPWQLARATGAAVVPGVVLCEGSRHRLVLETPFAVARGPDRQEDWRVAAERYTAWFSGMIEKFPAHYAPYLLLRHRVRHTDAQPFFGPKR